MGEYNDILELEKGYIAEFKKEHMTMPERKRFEESKVIVEKIQMLDLKKGDVLLITINDDRGDLPRNIFDKLNYKRSKAVTERVKHIYGNSVQVIFIPSSMDVSVLRLEEWFV